jgi:hypothetical protein
LLAGSQHSTVTAALLRSSRRRSVGLVMALALEGE